MSQSASPVAQQFVEAMNAKFPAVNPYDPHYEVVVGRKYEKIVMRRGQEGGMSAHAFFDPAVGLLYKAEGWSKPAKGARYSMDEQSVESVVAKADRFGGYLYR